MKKIIATLTLSAFVVIMVNCSPKVGKAVTAGPVPSSADVKAQYSTTQLDQGKMIWQDHCNKCHKLFEPGSRSPEKWNSVLKIMIPRARLNMADAQLVRAYLIANAAQPDAGSTQQE
jgi:hypothetical protein